MLKLALAEKMPMPAKRKKSRKGKSQKGEIPKGQKNKTLILNCQR
jgi:hypothetical protein